MMRLPSCGVQTSALKRACARARQFWAGAAALSLAVIALVVVVSPAAMAQVAPSGQFLYVTGSRTETL
jgi:hypothetical protein